MKYCYNKVKIGDYVYIRDGYLYDSKCKYKVLALREDGSIIVEVKDNNEDKHIILGWPTDKNLYIKTYYNLPSGVKAWFVHSWKKAERKCLNIE